MALRCGFIDESQNKNDQYPPRVNSISDVLDNHGNPTTALFTALFARTVLFENARVPYFSRKDFCSRIGAGGQPSK